MLGMALEANKTSRSARLGMVSELSAQASRQRLNALLYCILPETRNILVLQRPGSLLISLADPLRSNVVQLELMRLHSRSPRSGPVHQPQNTHYVLTSPVLIDTRPFPPTHFLLVARHTYGYGPAYQQQIKAGSARCLAAMPLYPHVCFSTSTSLLI
jgi:hypothetical protein